MWLHYSPGRLSRGSLYCPLVIGKKRLIPTLVNVIIPLGIVKALGDELGIKELVIKQVKSKAKGDDEDVFRVRWLIQYHEVQTSARISITTKKKKKEKDGAETETSSSSSGSPSTHRSEDNVARRQGLDDKGIFRLFPFHIIFDKSMTIKQIGAVSTSRLPPPRLRANLFLFFYWFNQTVFVESYRHRIE